MKKYGTIHIAESAQREKPKPKRAHCHKGHDIRHPDSTYLVILPSGRELLKCRRCQVQKGVTPNGKKTHCVRGHDLTLPGAVYSDRACRRCKAEKYASRVLSQGRLVKTRSELLERDLRTQEMLRLIEARERCATHWERKEIDDRYAELLRLNTGEKEE